MSETENFFNSLYSRFLLRDVFGKVVPGTIFLLSVVLSLDRAAGLQPFVLNLPLLAWPIVYGGCWLTGFAIQSLGSTLRVVRSYLPHPRVNDETFQVNHYTFHRHLREVRNRGNEHDRQQVERFVVIKEATGNTFVALLSALLLWLISTWPTAETLRHLSPALASATVILVFLLVEHGNALKRQWEYMNAVVPFSEIVMLEGTRPSTTAK